MKKIALLSFVLLVTPLAAHASAFSDAVDETSDALKDVEEASRACRSAVSKKLTRIKKDMREMGRRPSRSDLKSIARELSAVVDAAEEDCPKSVRRKLESALDTIESLAKKDDDDEEDRSSRRRDDREDREERAPKKKKVDCWSSNDPGCEHTRDGQPPMGRAAFSGLLTAVRAQKPHIFPMVDTLKAGVANQYMTSLQLATVLEELKPHVHPMLDAVKACAPRLVDPQNGMGIAAQFQPHVFPAQEATQIIASQRGD